MKNWQVVRRHIGQRSGGEVVRDHITQDVAKLLAGELNRFVTAGQFVYLAVPGVLS